MKIKIKDLIKLLETLDQEAIIDDLYVNPFEKKQNILDVYILENYQEIEDGRKFDLSNYEIDYSKGTIELQYSQPTTELDIDISDRDDWMDCIVYARDVMKNTIKLGE